jgi:hypothetical protein
VVEVQKAESRGRLLKSCRIVGWIVMVWGFMALFRSYQTGEWRRGGGILLVGMLLYSTDQLVGRVRSGLARRRAARR